MASLIHTMDRIDKLNGNNYRSWKFNMKMLLVQRELWEHVAGEATEPANENDLEQFNRKKEKALAAIALSVEADQQVHILDCETAHEAWEALKKVFEPKSRPRILQLRKQMVSLKLEPDENMTSYLGRIKICSDGLKDAGYEIKDDDLAYTMLSGLPESYEGIVMALANMDDDKFKSSEIKGILLSEYDRRTAKEMDGASQQKEAFAASRQKEAHHQAKEMNRQPADRRKEERTCFKCNRKGHIAINCRAPPAKVNWKNGTPVPRKHKDTFLLEVNNIQLDDHWLIDSGATHHICKHQEWFVNYRQIENEVIYSADSHTKNQLKAIGIGDINIETRVNNNVFSLTLQNVYHVPNVRRNLLSVSQIESKNKRLIFDNGKVIIYNKTSKLIVGEAFYSNGLYIIKTESIKNDVCPAESHVVSKNKTSNNQIWHQRFCHVSLSNITELYKRNLVRGLENITNENIHCNGCSVGKSTKAPCKQIKHRQSNAILELVHSDLCGPMKTESIGGSKYFLTLTDDYSRKITVYCLAGKNEVSSYIKKYIARVERETDRKVKKIRTDNGLEFCNTELKTLFNNLGIIHQRTNTYTPQMNGVAERINRTLLDLVRAMLKEAQLPDRFWAETLMAACYIKNRVIHSAISDGVPESVWTGNIPSVRHLRSYGCLAYVHIPKPGRHKLDKRARECILVGYSNQTKGYRLWDPKVDDIIQTKHVEFVEDICGFEYIYQKKTYSSPIDEEENVHETIDETEVEKFETNNDKVNDSVNSIDRTTYNLRNVPGRDRTVVYTPNRDKVIRNPWGRGGKPTNIEINLSEIIEPVTFDQAIASPQCEEWKEAMNEELSSLESRDTWEIVDKTADIKCIGSKWVYKIKTDPTGKVVKYKARLVAQGFNQKKDVDYFESYAPVANISSIRLLLALSVSQDWKVHHLDVKCAYLYGDLAEDIYMRLPPGYDISDTKVAKLKRPIYGLKQSGRNWNNAIDSFLTESGCKRLKTNNCIYVYDNEVIIAIYVDDIILFTKNMNKLERVKSMLMSKYEMRDLNTVSYLLGIRVDYREQTMRLSQKLYIEKLLTEYNVEECKPVNTPVELGIKLSKSDSPVNELEKKEMEEVPYRRLVGSLMYIALATRPDILYITIKLSEFASNPGKLHWIQAKRVLKYLATTKDKALTYSSGNNELEVFSDADWASDIDDRHSYSGMVAFLGGNAISWKSNKQKSISTSTMEAEYVALATAVKEIIGINMMCNELKDLKIVEVPCEPHVIRCDNKSAIDFTMNRVERSRSKHIDIAYHITRESYEQGLIKLKYVSSGDNVADILTKGLPNSVNKTHVQKLRLCETEVQCV